MNKLLLIYGCILLGGVAVANNQQSTESTFVMEHTSNEVKESSSELDLSEIVFIEEDAEIDLGFNTADYLPEDFNPYKAYFNLDSITYIEEEEELALDFDTNAYLPKGFDPYTEVVPVNSINFIEEESIDLGFDTKKYLPKGFSPYKTAKKPYMEEKVILEFDACKIAFDPILKLASK
nr:hypothetical protein [uncultured Allomuricauda sp.]